MRNLKKCARLAAPAVVATAALAFMARAHGDVLDTTWLGGAGTWQDLTQWSGGVIPNNSGSTTFNVLIPAGAVTSRQTVTINTLTLNGDLHILGPQYFKTAATTRIDGTLNLDQGGRLIVGTDGAVTGSGTIALGEYSGSLTAVFGSLTIGEGLTVTARVGHLGDEHQPLLNRGHVVGGRNSSVYCPTVAGSPLVNEGVIEAREGIVALDGTFTFNGLGKLVWGAGGEFLLAGTLLNQDQTFRVEAATPWTFGGTVIGGKIEVANGLTLHVADQKNAVLDGVELAGTIGVGRGSILYIADGVLRGNGTIMLSQDGTGGDRANVLAPTPALTISQGMTIRGGDTSSSFPFGSSIGAIGGGPFENFGTIRPDAGRTLIVFGTITNHGTLGIAAGSAIQADGDLRLEPGSVLQVELSDSPTGGLLFVDGALDLTASADAVNLSLIAGAASLQEYLIVQSTTILGKFDSVTPGFELDYRGNEIWARLVPEPTALALPAVTWLVSRFRRPVRRP